jgi:hypothetical protein
MLLPKRILMPMAIINTPKKILMIGRSILKKTRTNTVIPIKIKNTPQKVPENKKPIFTLSSCNFLMGTSKN